MRWHDDDDDDEVTHDHADHVTHQRPAVLESRSFNRQLKLTELDELDLSGELSRAVKDRECS